MPNLDGLMPEGELESEPRCTRAPRTISAHCGECEQAWKQQRIRVPAPRLCCAAMHPKQPLMSIADVIRYWNSSGGWCQAEECSKELLFTAHGLEVTHRMVRDGDHPGPVDYSAREDVWTIQRDKGWGFHQPWNILGVICNECQHFSNANELRCADPDRGASLGPSSDGPNLPLGGPFTETPPEPAILVHAGHKDRQYERSNRRRREKRQRSGGSARAGGGSGIGGGGGGASGGSSGGGGSASGGLSGGGGSGNGGSSGGGSSGEGAAAAYNDAELEVEVERRLMHHLDGASDCSFDELFDVMAESDVRIVASGREAVERALDAMESANKVMHREGRIHLI